MKSLRLFILLSVMCVALLACAAPIVPSTEIPATEVPVTVAPIDAEQHVSDFDFELALIDRLEFTELGTSMDIRYAVTIDKCLVVSLPATFSTLQIPIDFTFCNAEFISTSDVDLYSKVQYGIERELKAMQLSEQASIKVPTLEELQSTATLTETYQSYLVIELPTAGDLYAAKSYEEAAVYYSKVSDATRRGYKLPGASEYSFLEKPVNESPVNTGTPLGIYLTGYSNAGAEYMFFYKGAEVGKCLSFSLPQEKLTLDLAKEYGDELNQRILKFETSATFYQCN